MMKRQWLKADWDPGLTVVQLPLEHLLDRGITCLLLDVDRTLLPGKDVRLPDAVMGWASSAQRHLRMHLFSNNPSKQRISAVAEQLGVSFTSGAAKPRRAALCKVLSDLQVKPEELAIIGDRVFTDVLAGNRLGLYTVLVRPLKEDGTACSHDRVQRLEKGIARFLGAQHQ